MTKGSHKFASLRFSIRIPFALPFVVNSLLQRRLIPDAQLSAALLALCLVTLPVLALDSGKRLTQYSLHKWQVAQGLPDNSINAVVQTRDGYLWLGTRQGLARFDGAQFTIFNRQNTAAIKHNVITALYEDANGALWIGTENGLVRYYRRQWNSYTTDNGLSANWIHSICGGQENTDELWLGTEGGGLNRLRDGVFTALRPPTANPAAPHNVVLALHRAADGSLWAGTLDGLLRYKDERFTVYGLKDGLSDQHVHAITADAAGTLWIGTERGLNSLRDGEFTNYFDGDNSGHSVGSSFYKVLSLDADGNLWVGSFENGLRRFQNGEFAAFQATDGLTGNQVRAIATDREGNLWVGTTTGLNRFNEGTFTTYGKSEGLSADSIWSVLGDQRGNLWLGTFKGGLNRFDNNTFTALTTRDGLAKDYVTALHETADGTLWVGTFGAGLQSYRDGRWTTYTTENGLSHNTVRATAASADGTLWIGTEQGLSRFRDNEFTNYRVADGLSDSHIIRLHLDRAGKLWIGTKDGGLNSFDNEIFVHYAAEQGSPDNEVRSIHEDAEGTLWLATNGGISRFKNNVFTVYTAGDGLPDNDLTAILEDDAGKLWVGSSRGIFTVSKQALTDFEPGGNRMIAVINYDTTDGLKSSECSKGAQPSAFKTADGRLWFGTQAGVAVVDPRRTRRNEVAPPVFIENVAANDQSVGDQLQESAQTYAADSNRIEIAAGVERVQFRYTGLSFAAPERMRFRYRLDGFDRDWVEAGTRRAAFYTNLPPGDYTFRVMAANNDGLWNETGAAVSLRLLPHFYQTKIFAVFCLLIGATLIGVFYRLRVRHLTRREAELQRRVGERTAELQQEIGERRTAEAALQHAEKQLRTVIDNSPVIFFALDQTGVFTVSEGKGLEALDLSSGTVVGQSVFDVYQDYPEILLNVRQALDGSAVSFISALGAVAFENRCVPLVNENGETTGIIGVAYDVTERQQIESALKEARDAAVESARLKSEFLANMSHEIRTPMNGVIGMTGLLLDTALLPEQRDFAETIRSSGEALLTIINDILDFSKIEASKLEIETIDFDLRNTIEETVELLAERAQSKGLELICSIHPKVPVALRGDPGRLRQILTNLIGNAVKFTERGEVAVRVTLFENGSAQIESAAPDSERKNPVRLRFEVLDTGIGISETGRKRLFQSFAQADGSTTRRYGGTGLGLAISKQLVELMNGAINVTSVEGAGSTFWFVVPFEQQPPTPLTPFLPAPVELLGRKVLIVDDNRTNRQLLTVLAQKWGMLSAEAAEPATALKMMTNAADSGEPFDMALLDFMMPEMDGFELAGRIGNDSDLSKTKLVMLTSYGQRGHAQQARQAKIAAYLTKPIRETKLFDCLRTVISADAQPDASNSPRSVAPQQLITQHTLAERQHNRRVLIAEDNPVNQRVARGMLEKLGYQVELVDNGRAAVEVVARETFALVLMDCQMPEMDGFAATEAIRRSEANTARRVPIVAMTASALESDRERCFAAGMDDYISKPVRAEELRRTLERSLENPERTEFGADLGQAAQPRPRSIDPEEQPNVDDSVIDRPRLLEIRDLGDDNQDLLLEMIDYYRGEMHVQLTAIRQAARQENVAQLLEDVHRTKGMNANLGLVEVARLCERIEVLCAEGGELQAFALVARLEPAYRRGQYALDQEIAAFQNWNSQREN